MLTLFRYHSLTCAHKSEGRDWNRCRCRIWYDWSIDGRRIRKPIGTRDWSRAQQIARELEAVGRVESKVAPLIKSACDEFVTDARVRGLREPASTNTNFYSAACRRSLTARVWCSFQILMSHARPNSETPGRIEDRQHRRNWKHSEHSLSSVSPGNGYQTIRLLP